MRTASIFLLALFQKGRVSAQDAVQPRPFNYRGMRILFTTMMLALITTSAEAQELRKAPREGEQPPKAPVSRFPPLASQSSAIDRILGSHVPLCDLNEFVVRSGSALVEFIRSGNYECISPLFGNRTERIERIRMAAFQQENMIYVAGATAQFATTYDGTDPQDRLHNLYYFLRAGYYNEFYDEHLINWTDEVDRAMAGALDAFIENAHFYDTTGQHGYLLSEFFDSMDGLGAGSGSKCRRAGGGYRVRYLPTVKAWLAQYDSRHAKFWYLSQATENLFYWLSRALYDSCDYRDVVATDAELMNILYDLTISDELVRVNYAYDQKSILGEAARELARFLEYKSAPVYSTVLSRVKSVLDYYDPLGPYVSIWIAAVEGIYDSDACADLGVCGIKTEFERRLLSMEYSCNENLAIRTQNMTPFEMDKACVKLRKLERVFHQRLNTNYEPVADDFNARLEIVVFSDSDSYDTYSYFLFGNSTSNGGIYLEGEPSDPSNTARFYAYNADWLPESPVWNLEHEYIHYLDGRFIKYGPWNRSTQNTIWWEEGLAEYLTKAELTESERIFIRSARDRIPLSGIFAIDNYHKAELYARCYLAMRFMFEKHPEEVDSFIGYLRVGDYDGYENYTNESIGVKYDNEWSTWLGEFVQPE